ncbi:MAG: glycosyltransferase [Bacilli bacterium]
MEKIIRVLHCVVKMDVGGAENLIMNLYRSIDKNVIQFDFLTSLPGIYDEEIKKMGGKIYHIPYYKKTGMFSYYFNLLKFFKFNKYNTVHSHMDCISGVILLAAKKRGVNKRISHSHSTKNSGNFIFKMYKNLCKLFINKAANIKLACSKEAATWLYGNKASGVIVIKNGINMKNFIHNDQTNIFLRKELNIPTDAFVIGHVGRFEKVKNHKFIIEIFDEFNKLFSNSFLVLIGNGSLINQIKDFVATKKNSQNIIFIDNVLDIYNYYNLFNAFVLPSLYEGLPLTLIESQTAGLDSFISTNITDEVNISKLIHKIDLKQSNKFWAQTILATSTKNFINLEQISLSGFDIGDTLKKIVSIYKN